VLRDALLVGGIVVVATAIAIPIRQIDAFSTFWPVEAVLIGMMVRNPSLARPAGWAAAFAGYLLSGLFTGGDLALVLWVSAANLLSAIVGFTLFQQLPEGDRRLQRPRSTVYMFAIILAAAFVNAVVGGGVSAIAEPDAGWTGLEFWLSSDIANYLIVLPILLTAPAHLPAFVWHRSENFDPARAAPFVGLLASGAISVMVGGPGATAIAIPALLWCALTYSMFTTVLLTMAYSVWKIATFSAGAITVDPGASYEETMASVRLGITLLTLGPLAVASINAAREELLQTLDRSVNYDYLTGALARSAFMDRGQRLCEALRPSGSMVVLVMDIDQFKNVNDSYGHAAGDQVLIAFAEEVSRTLRPGDLFGRLGGEEFAVILPDISDDDAHAQAERVRERVAGMGIVLDGGQPVFVTVSIGMVRLRCRARSTMDPALAAADQALYAAKAAGRNRVVTAKPI
jgi:diguanylate cyclase (GGDEF)-like protein